MDFYDRQRQKLGLEPVIAPIFERAEARNQVIPSTAPPASTPSAVIPAVNSGISELQNPVIRSAALGAFTPRPVNITPPISAEQSQKGIEAVKRMEGDLILAGYQRDLEAARKRLSDARTWEDIDKYSAEYEALKNKKQETDQRAQAAYQRTLDNRTAAEKLIDDQVAAGETYDDIFQSGDRMLGITPYTDKTYTAGFTLDPAANKTNQELVEQLNAEQVKQNLQHFQDMEKKPEYVRDLSESVREEQINDSKTRLEAQEKLNTMQGQKAANPVLYSAMQFGAGTASPVFSMTSGVAAGVRDALDGGKTSDDFQKISQYYAEHPEAVGVGQTQTDNIYGGRGLYDFKLADKMGVSVNSLDLYRKSEINNNIAQVINDEIGATTPDWYKNTLGQALYSIGAQVIPLTATMGTSGGGAGFIDTLLNHAKPSQALTALLKPNATTALMGASVAGSKYTDLAKIYGADPVNFVNALATGYSEALTENLGGFTDAGSIKKLFDSRSFGKNVLKFLLNNAEEAVEEVANVPLEGLVDKYTVDPDKAWTGSGGVFDLENMLESGVQGALVSALMGGPAAVASTTQYVRESRDARRGIQALNAVSEISLPESMRPQAPDTKNATMEDYMRYADAVTQKIDQLAQIVKNTASTGGIRPVRLPDGSTVYVDQNNNPTGTIPDMPGLQDAINKKWNLNSHPNNAADAVPRVYVQDAENKIPAPIIPGFDGNSNRNANQNASANVTETGRTSWKQRVSNQNGVYTLTSADGQRSYTIPDSQEVSYSVTDDGTVKLNKSIAESVNPRDYRDFVKAYADKNLITKFDNNNIIIEAKPILISSDGNEVIITNTGIKDFAKKIRGQGIKSKDNLDSVLLLDKIIQNSHKINDSPNSKGKVNPFSYYESMFSVGDRDYKVNLRIKNTPQNNQYYYHSLENIEIAPSNETSYHNNGGSDLIVNDAISTPIIPGFSQKSNQNTQSNPVTRTQEADGKTISWSETQKDSVSNPAKAFEEKYGIETKVAKPSTKTDVSAFLQDGKIVLNADALNTYSGTVSKIAHEATHIIQGTEAWEGAKAAALAYYKAIDPNITMKDLKQWKAEEYRGFAELDSTQQVQEVVAGFLEDICSRNELMGEQAARVLVQENPKGFRRITQYFKDKVQSLKAYLPAGTGLNKQQRLELQAAQRGLKNLKKGLEAYRKGNVQTAQGTQYSISRDVNGKPFVVIDNDVIYNANASPSKVVSEIIKKQIGNIYPLVESGQKVYIGKDLPGEYAYSKYTQSLNKSTRKTKIQASQNLNEMIEIATDRRWERAKHIDKHNVDAKYGFYKYLTRFAVPRFDSNRAQVAYALYSADLLIRNDANGKKYLYDVLNIKKESSSLLPTWMNQSSKIRSTLSNTNVPQKANGVNNSISKTSKNDTSYSYGDSSVASLMEFMNRKYGTIPEGENAYRKVAVPRRTSEGTKTRQGVRTILEAKSTPGQMAEALKQQVVEDAYAYVPVSDKNAEMQAEKTIRDRGQKGALERWNAVVNGTELAGKETLALAEKLMVEAGKQGDVELFQKLAAEISAEATRAGQTVQAMRLIKKMTPEGQLYYLQKSLDSVQKDLKRRLKNKAPELEISEELAKELLEAKSQEEIDAAEQKIFVEIANQIPSTWMDKWDSWRYLAMLANPRTHIRNVLGNTVFVPARLMKNAVSMGIEHLRVGNHRLVKPENRTSAILTKSDKPLLEFAEKDFEAVKESLTSSGKMNPSNQIHELRKVYKTGWLETLRKANNKALDAEDMFFLKRAYTHSMAQIIKARKLDLDFLTGRTREANMQLQKIQALATQEALEATYRDASAMANALNRFKNSNPVANVFGNALFAFTKTPINVLKRGVEYSPAGLIKGAVDGISMVRSGKKTATEVVASLSKALSGTGIALLGYWLASMNLLVAGAPEDDKEKGFEALQGVKNYALKIGDTYYTIDWMAPVALPLFVGAELHNISEWEGFDLAAVADSLIRVSEPMFNLSMLDGINGAFKSITYSKGNYLTDFAAEAALDYISQALANLGKPDRPYNRPNRKEQLLYR